jgi:hypothetical protein
VHEVGVIYRTGPVVAGASLIEGGSGTCEHYALDQRESDSMYPQNEMARM